MLERVKQVYSKVRARPWVKFTGKKGVQIHGHRAYVGGRGAMWDRMGTLQFEFLIQQGLRPEHVFVDVACGSLRAGVHIIKYLDKGNYLGIDLEKELIERGIKYELGKEITAAKAPEFVVSGFFEFHKFSKAADYGIAQSLFTHLSKADIELCLKNLGAFMSRGSRFFATFNKAEGPVINPKKSHPHLGFWYTQEELALLGKNCGWNPTYIGDWGHPKDQKMMLYVK